MARQDKMGRKLNKILSCPKARTSEVFNVSAEESTDSKFITVSCL